MTTQTFTPGQTGYLVERHGGRGGKKKSDFDIRAVLYRFIGTSGQGRNTKYMFESARSGWRTCVNAVEFATGQMAFNMEGTPPPKLTHIKAYNPSEAGPPTGSLTLGQGYGRTHNIR